MNKLKIGVAIYANPDDYPPTINAVQILAKKYDVILVGRNQGEANWQYPSNVRVHRLGNYSDVRAREQLSGYSKLLEYLSFTNKVADLLQEVSLLYIYDPFAFVAICGNRRFKSQQVPIIYQLHEASETIFPLTSLSGWIQRLEKRWIDRANMLIFPDRTRADFFTKNITNCPQLTIVPNFPRREQFLTNPDLDANIARSFQLKQILLQGAISPDAAMLEIIDALTLLPDDNQLKFIGRINPEHLDLVSSAIDSNKLNHRFTYHEPVSYDRLRYHTEAASVGICLYKNIGLNHSANVTASNKIYEYIACGLPIIVSDFPNYRAFLGDESWVRFANPEEPESIAIAIQSIFSDFDNYRKMCLAARQAFEVKYNYETVFMPMLDYITESTEDNL